MRLSIERQTTAFIVTLIIVCIVVIGFIIRPTIVKIKGLNRQTVELRQTLEKKYQRSFQLHSSLTTIRSLSEETKNYANFVLRRNEELHLITLLENLAAQNQVVQTVQNANLDSSNKAPFTFSLSIKGTYANVLRYLARLEKTFPYFVIIDNVNLGQTPNRQADPNTTDQITLTLNMHIYAE